MPVAAGLSICAFWETALWLMAWNELPADSPGDALAAGVPIRDAGLKPTVELGAGPVAWDGEATSSAAGCAIVD